MSAMAFQTLAEFTASTKAGPILVAGCEPLLACLEGIDGYPKGVMPSFDSG